MTRMSLAQVFSSLVQQKRIGYLLIGILVLSLSCSGYPIRGDRPRGVYHRVKSGETLSAIAKAYRVNLQDLAEINKIGKSDRIEVDSVIFIPGALQVVDDVLAASGSKVVPDRTPAVRVSPSEESATKEAAAPRQEVPKERDAAEEEAEKQEKKKERVPAEAAVKDRAARERDKAAGKVPEKTGQGDAGRGMEKKAADEGKAGDIRGDKNRFIWPVNGRVVTRFGAESIMADYNGKKVETAKIMNNGIKIAAGSGTPVCAAAAGKVIYSMLLERFGNTIIIEHADEYKTVYYGLGKRLVETLQQVKKGDPIAHIGESNASKNEMFMHFEIRHRNKPRDPLFFLP